MRARRQRPATRLVQAPDESRNSSETGHSVARRQSNGRQASQRVGPGGEAIADTDVSARTPLQSPACCHEQCLGARAWEEHGVAQGKRVRGGSRHLCRISPATQDAQPRAQLRGRPLTDRRVHVPLALVAVRAMWSTSDVRQPPSTAAAEMALLGRLQMPGWLQHRKRPHSGVGSSRAQRSPHGRRVLICNSACSNFN